MSRSSISDRWSHPYDDEPSEADTVPPAVDPADLESPTAQLERNYRTVLETFPDGVLVFDGAGVVQYANPAAARLFDARVDSLLGRQFGVALAVNTTVELKPAKDRRLEMRVESTVWQDEPAFLACLTDVSERRAGSPSGERTQRAIDLARQAGRACARLRTAVGRDEALAREIETIERALKALREQAG